MSVSTWVGLIHHGSHLVYTLHWVSPPIPPMSKPLMLVVLLMCVLGMGLSGCSIGGYTLAKRAELDGRIEAARAETTAKLEALRQQEVSLLNQAVAAHQSREQLAADYLFKGGAVFGTLKPDLISRATLVMGQSIQQTAAQLPPASSAAQAATFKALQTELDETKTSTEALKAQYERELGIARAEGAAKAKVLEELDTKVRAVEAEKSAALAKALTTEQSLQAAKDKVQDKDAAAARQAAADAQRNERLKLWLMGGLGVIALAAGIAAVYVPIPSVKRYGAIVAVAAAGAALAVPFIQPFHVLIGILCICVPVGLRIVWVYKQEHGDATDTFRALNEVKVKAPEVFKDAVAPLLREWHTDPATSKRIDERLRQVGDI